MRVPTCDSEVMTPIQIVVHSDSHEMLVVSTTGRTSQWNLDTFILRRDSVRWNIARELPINWNACISLHSFYSVFHLRFILLFSYDDFFFSQREKKNTNLWLWNECKNPVYKMLLEGEEIREWATNSMFTMFKKCSIKFRLRCSCEMWVEF